LAQLTTFETVEFNTKVIIDRGRTTVSMESIQSLVWYILDLVELSPLSDLLVGNDAAGGLSFEQKKRLSLAVELVANPSVIFLGSVFGFREGHVVDSNISTV
jgi:ABC-type multidrug transport system ATPase subunit